MNLTDQFLNFSLIGAEWVLWLLVALSILSIGIMVERFLFFKARAIDTKTLSKDIRAAFDDDDAETFHKRYGHVEKMAVLVARRGLDERKKGIDAVSEAMNSEKTRVKKDHEQFLIVLGTLGNNAPFIGLLGTVIGIIKAFNDLAEDSQGGAEVVMSGISEALVATAVGLLVAIPAVIGFNYFNRRVRAETVMTDDIAHTILAELHGKAHQQSAEGKAS